MLHGPSFVAIVVTQAALSEIDQVAPEVGGLLACFHRHCDKFEQIANAKHRRGLVEEDGAVIVQAGDLTTFGV